MNRFDIGASSSGREAKNVSTNQQSKQIAPPTHSMDTDYSKPPIVSIIIPLFNKAELTANCLETLFKHTPAGLYELVLVDNASTDRTSEVLDIMPSTVKVIRNRKNLGFAEACNQGAQQAKGKYLLFLNNDTELLPGWLEPLIQVLDNDSQVGAVGSKLLYPDGTIQHAGVVVVDDQHMADPLVAKINYNQKPSDYAPAQSPRTYQALTAACLMVRKDVFQQVGGFDEGYWNGYEDVDLCFKLGQAGWKLVYQPASVVVHHESQSGPERLLRVNDNIESACMPSGSV